jgi:hypothetical protein
MGTFAVQKSADRQLWHEPRLRAYPALRKIGEAN